MGNWVAAKNHAESVVNAAVAAQAPPIFSPSLDLLESRYGFGMGSEQPKRCRGRWPCHRTPKGTAGMGGETNYEKREMRENPSRWGGLRRARPRGGGGLQVAAGEFPAGAGFEIAFEGGRFFADSKSMGRLNGPRFAGRG